MQGVKNRDFRPISRFISEMVQDGAIATISNANMKPYRGFWYNLKFIAVKVTFVQ